MLKVIIVICFLIAMGFVISGFIEVASAPDLFERSENSSAAEDNEVLDE